LFYLSVIGTVLFLILEKYILKRERLTIDR